MVALSLLIDLMVVRILAATFAFGHTLWPCSPFPFPLAFSRLSSSYT